MSTVPTGAAPPGPPRWLDGLVTTAALGVVALGLAGLPLALAGQFRRLPVLGCSAVVFAVLVLLWHRRERPPTAAPSRAALVCAALALAVAGTSAAVNVSQHSAHLIVDGDPAVYGVTGKLLAREGALVLPTYEAQLYGSNAEVNYAGSGFYESEGEPTFYPQFLHLLPALLAVADWIGGTPLLLAVNPVIGALSLLAFYCFAARLTRPPWALLAMTSLAVLLPQVHFSRDMFSELPSQLLVFTGLAMLWDVQGRARQLAAPVVAGLVLGGSALARGDAFLYLVPLAAALLLVRAGRTGWAVLAGAAAAAGVALADGVLASPFYLGSLKGPLVQTAAALVLLAGAAAAARRRPGWVPGLAHRLAWPAAAGVVALAAFAWFVRPAVQVARDIPSRTNGPIASLQKSEGLAVDVPRSYDEATMQWLSWYLGPVALVLGVLGLAYLLHRVLRGHDPRAAPFVLLAVLVTAVYVWKPAIFPVQYWATRRFLPVSFPALILGAVLVCERLYTASRAHRTRQTVAVAGAAAVLLFPLALLPGATLPRNYDGFQLAITQMCGSLLPQDVVLFLGGGSPANGLPQAVRGHCGIPAASAGADATAADVAEVAAATRAAGRRLVLLSGSGEPALAPPGATFRKVFDVTVPTTALSISGRPDAVFPYRVLLFQAVL